MIIKTTDTTNHLVDKKFYFETKLYIKKEKKKRNFMNYKKRKFKFHRYC